METSLLLALVVALGIGAQWLGWYSKQPAILFLLATGILIGPVLHVFQPDQVLGDLLFPFISLGVAVILFEGALTLEFEEITHHGCIIHLLVSVGMLITITVLSITCYFLFDVDWRIALLFGSLVCVTGPTVIAPLIRSVHPTKKIANILKWEGILVDPVGAIAVVLVYEYIISEGQSNEFTSFAKIILIATGLGLISAFLLAKLIKRHLVPEYLRNVFVLAYILTIFTFSNHLAHESGLLTVTILGVALANWKGFPKEHILEFKESLTILLVSILFIILAARVNLTDLVATGWAGVALLAVAMFVARPLAIWVSAIGSNLTTQEKLMISWIGPRGIVAAAISSLFAIRLQNSGIQGVNMLVPLVFVIIIGTVFIQGLGAKKMAKLLGVCKVADTGVLVVGANPVARMLAKSLQDADVEVIIASSHYEDIAKARMLGLRTYFGSPISTHADNNLDLLGLGYLFAMSTDKEINTLCQWHYSHEFGDKNIYRMRCCDDVAQNPASRLDLQENYQPNWLFSTQNTYHYLADCIENGARTKVTNLTENYTFAQYQADNEKAIPLYIIDENNFITVCNENSVNIPVKCRLVSLVKP